MRDLKALLRLLRGKRVAFIGDSISGQVANALECQLRRLAEEVRDVSIRVEAPELYDACTPAWAAVQRGSVSAASWEDSQCRALGPGTFATRARQMDAKYMTLGGVHVPKYNFTFIRRFGDVYHYMRPLVEVVDGRTIRTYHLPSHIALVRAHDIADTIVFNFGLHAGNETTYKLQMAHALDELDAFAALPAKAAVVRETSAQHFPAASGDYHDALRADPTLVLTPTPAPAPELTSSSERRRPSSSKRGRDGGGGSREWTGPSMCRQIAAGAPIHWRNAAVRELFEKRGYRHLRLQPFEDLTRGRWDFHSSTRFLGGHWKSDCTHWCYSDCFWQLSFHDLQHVLANVRASQRGTY